MGTVWLCLVIYRCETSGMSVRSIVKELFLQSFYIFQGGRLLNFQHLFFWEQIGNPGSWVMRTVLFCLRAVSSGIHTAGSEWNVCTAYGRHRVKGKIALQCLLLEFQWKLGLVCMLTSHLMWTPLNEAV